MNYYPIPSEICAIITTFRPDDELYKRVMRLQGQVGLIVIVDDGACNENVLKLEKWFENEKKIKLHHNICNVGIATSLNVGISIAKENEYKWILTLDDDSLVRENFIEKLINGLKRVKLDKPVGIIGLSCVEPNSLVGSKPITESIKYSEKRGIITSGSLFSMETYDIVGLFRDEFYIDSVDYDYCLRARRKGLAVIKLDEIGFEHMLGHSKVVSIMGLKIIVENHEAFRIYYGFRNLTVLALEYLLEDPLYSIAVLVRQVKTLFIVILFEKDKAKKIIEAFKGLKDGLRGNLGKRIKLHG